MRKSRAQQQAQAAAKEKEEKENKEKKQDDDAKSHNQVRLVNYDYIHTLIWQLVSYKIRLTE